MLNQTQIETMIDEFHEFNEYGYKYIRWDIKPNPILVQDFKEKYNINTDCHFSCQTCQINQINKYKDVLEIKNKKSIEETGQPLEKWFPVKCSYIKKGLPSHFSSRVEALKNAGIDEKKIKRMMLSSIDPASWAELMFGFDDETFKDPNFNKHWFIRWYQKHALRCSAQKIVFRQGRRSGKSAVSSLKIIDKVFNKKVFKGKNPETGEDIIAGPAIAIITPFQSQVSALFDEIEKFVKSNKELEKMVIPRGSKLYKQTPPMQMDFKNGSSIVGFVTGSNNKEDGSGGGSIRGAISADDVYLDEMDMIPENIFKKVIEPLRIGKPSVCFMGSSTPIGKKSTFYNWCLLDPSCKEIYVPSTAIPHWHLIKDECESEGGQDAFRAEYMAEFITDSYGVFKNEQIVAARSDYKYSQTLNHSLWDRFGEDYSKFIICIGIDWNQKVGTEYSVVAWSPISTDFWILENLVIPGGKHSGEAYKEMVKELNYKYNPKYIYADYGYGHFLIEDLEVESAFAAREDNPNKAYDIGLGAKLHTICFSANIELYNPAKGTFFKKYTKDFLVQNAVQIFEREKIHFAESDNVLIKQLGNYIEIEKKDNGKVIYGMESETVGDHRLDAVMLALGGLVKEESLYANNFNTITGAYYNPKPDQSSDDGFVSAVQQATDMKALLLKNRIPGRYEGIVLSRGRSIEQDHNGYREKMYNQGIKPPNHNPSRDIDLNKAERGFFHSKGLVNSFIPNTKGEDNDEAWKFVKPVIPTSHKGRTIRTTSIKGNK